MPRCWRGQRSFRLSWRSWRCACSSRASAGSRSTSRTSARCTSGRCRAPAASRCSSAPRLRSLSAPPASGCRWRSRSSSPSVSFFDDLRGLPTAVRLAAHVAAAAFLVWYVLSPMLAVEMLVLILAVAWITNLYNFMDGSDGLAGGMAMIGFGAYGVAAWWGRRHRACRPLRRAVRGGLRLPAAQPPPGAHLPRRRGFDPARLPRRRARHRRLAQRPLAAVVSGAGVRTVHRRRHDHAGAACAAARARLAGAPRPLLPADGAHGPRPPRHGVDRLCGDAAVRRRGASRARSAAGDAGHGVPGDQRRCSARWRSGSTCAGCASRARSRPA